MILESESDSDTLRPIEPMSSGRPARDESSGSGEEFQPSAEEKQHSPDDVVERAKVTSDDDETAEEKANSEEEGEDEVNGEQDMVEEEEDHVIDEECEDEENVAITEPADRPTEGDERSEEESDGESDGFISGAEEGTDSDVSASEPDPLAAPVSSDPKQSLQPPKQAESVVSTQKPVVNTKESSQHMTPTAIPSGKSDVKPKESPQVPKSNVSVILAGKPDINTMEGQQRTKPAVVPDGNSNIETRESVQSAVAESKPTRKPSSLAGVRVPGRSLESAGVTSMLNSPARRLPNARVNPATSTIASPHPPLWRPPHLPSLPTAPARLTSKARGPPPALIPASSPLASRFASSMGERLPASVPALHRLPAYPHPSLSAHQHFLRARYPFLPPDAARFLPPQHQQLLPPHPHSMAMSARQLVSLPPGVAVSDSGLSPSVDSEATAETADTAEANREFGGLASYFASKVKEED